MLPQERRKDDDEKDVDEVPIGVEVLCCAFSADGEFFAVGASDGVVRVYSDSTRVSKGITTTEASTAGGGQGGVYIRLEIRSL